MKKKYLISVGLIGALAVSSSVYANSTKFLVSNQKGQAVSTVYSTEKTIESNSNIKDKMLNAIDYYDSVKGTYNVVIKPLDVDETVHFEVSEGSKKGSYIEKINNKSGRVISEKADGQFKIVMNNEKRQFIKSKLGNLNNFDKTKPRTYKEATGEAVYVYRPDPAVADGASDVVFPQTYAFWLQDNYKIVRNDTFLGRDVNVIEGTLPKDLSEKHDAVTFTMLVDSKTGILLELIEKNEDGVITNKIEVTSIEFNKNVDGSKFSTDELTKDFTEVKLKRNSK